MALKTSDQAALREAISLVLEHCGEDADLHGKLETLQKDLGADESAKSSRDHADDDYSFETAEKRHAERLAASRGGESTDGGEGK
jgi:hypothetical protein